MSNSRKRLIKNEVKETSNHTQILSEDEELIDLQQFAYQKKSKQTSKSIGKNNQLEKQDQFTTLQNVNYSLNENSQFGKNSKQKLQQSSQQSKESAQKKQSNLFQFFGKTVAINPNQRQNSVSKQKNQDVDIEDVDIEEQIRIEKQILEKHNNNKIQTNKIQPINKEIEKYQYKNKVNLDIDDDDIIQQLKKIDIKNKSSTPQNVNQNTGFQKTFEITLNNDKQKKGKKGINIEWSKSSILKPEQKQTQPQQKSQIQQELQGQSFQNDPNLLKGFTIVLSGILSVCNRDKLEELLQKNGAKVTGQISGKTSYLILGNKLEDGRNGEQGNKFKAATLKGTKIIREDELENWILNHFGVSLEEIFVDAKMSTLYHNSRKHKREKQQQQQQQQQLLLADKYTPECLDELVGNKAGLRQLYDWIDHFQNPRVEQENSKQKKKYIPFKVGRFQPVGNLSSKACIISGPPGVGKSSLVRLIAEAMNLKLIINNASDKRNKSSLREILNSLIDNKVLMNLFKPNKNFIILMDEVDGMTGSDRGGISALIECIKSTRVPIVCICNNLESTKLSSLIPYCYSIRFDNPSSKLVAQRLKSICKQENINMNIEDLEKMAECFNGDIRQSINMLELQINQQKLKTLQPQKFSKDRICVFNVFNASQTLLNKQQRQNLNLREMMDMFFLDYDLIPLIIQDNFIKAQHQNISDIKKAAELIAESDVISKKIRRDQQWSLMPSFGFLSSVYPSTLSGNTLEFPKFPTWLGKNSTATKIKRQGQFIKKCLAPISYLTSDIKLYSKYLVQLLKAYLELRIQRNDKEAIQEVVYILEEYNMTPEILKDSLINQLFNPLKDDLLSNISPQIKANLTRQFNKHHFNPKEKQRKRGIQVQRQIADNYNPLIGEEAPLQEQEQAEKELDKNNEEEKEEEIKKKPIQRNKISNKKGTKKQNNNQKKQQQSESISLNQSINEETDGSLSGFIVDDDDE